MIGRRSAAPIEYVEPSPHRLLAPVTRAMLDVAVGRQPREGSVEVADGQWDDLWGALCRHRIETFLVPAVDRGVVTIPDEHRSKLRQRAQRMAMNRLGLRAELDRVGGHLRDAGVDYRVLKGLATGPLDHRNEAARRTTDVDLLLRPDQFDRGCDVVLAASASEKGAGSHADVWLRVERTFRTDARVEIDVHHRLFRFGRDPENSLFDDGDVLPGTDHQALSIEGRLVHAAAHLLISPPGHRQMSSLFDVAVIGASDRIDLSRALDLAARFGVRGITEHALWLARSIGSEDVEAAPVRPRTLIDRAHLRTGRRGDLETLAVLADLDTNRDRLRYLRQIAGRRPAPTR